jgi:hypothetical protein
MARPRTLLLLVAVAAAGVVIGRRLLRGPEERVDLYFEDGSMISFEGDSADAQRLLPVARDLLSTVG